MTDIITHMINPSGGVKRIQNTMVEEMLTKGWRILPSDQLSATGTPKQMYFPQMDRQNPSNKQKLSDSENGVGDMLPVEIF